ncbi:MAG: translation elongation factor Ts [Gemmatimonadetes bacterium]|nr:translation elongation factor Ts [Gemmatimonadota bacterium]
MSIDAQTVKELRTKTGAGIMDCKKALAETKGNLDEAVDFLRKKGLASAAKKAGRATKEGLIGSYVHSNGKIATMVEVNCETDFVARTDEFQQLARDLAMHVAAHDPTPLGVNREEIDSSVAEAERQVFLAQVQEMGKPAQVAEKIVEGKMDKWYAERTLLEQSFVKDPDQKVGDLLKAAVAKVGENIQISRFVRFQLGEGGN